MQTASDALITEHQLSGTNKWNPKVYRDLLEIRRLENCNPGLTRAAHNAILYRSCWEL